MEQQLAQAQGELSLVLQEKKGAAADGVGGIQLERVVISTESKQAGSRGRVVSIDDDWRFVVVNLGWNIVKIGDTISIFRQDELQAKARVERVQEGVAAASLLPKWDNADVQVNDVVRFL